MTITSPPRALLSTSILCRPLMGHPRLLLASLLSLASLVYAQPAQVYFDDCTSSATRSAADYDPNARINITNVYAQIAYPNGQKTLRIRVVADTNEDVQPSQTDSTGNLTLCTSEFLCVLTACLMLIDSTTRLPY